MRTLISLIAVSMLAAPLAGCLVRTDRHHHHHHGSPSARRGGPPKCGPAHHWNGYKCVHNGNGRGRRR